MIKRQMRRRERERGFEIRAAFVERLVRQREHQVEIEVLERARGDLDRGARLRGVVNPPERLQMRFVEALDADRQAIDAARAELRELRRLERAGVRLERDLGVRVERQQRAHVGQQPVEPRRRQQARRAAADEHRVYLASPDERQRVLEIGAQRVQIVALGQRAAVLPFVRIEVAVRALAHAPREVHVQRERRQRREPDPAGRGECRDDARAVGCRVAHRISPSRATSAFSASARWLAAFFAAGSSSAAVAPSAGTKKCGS